jgi:hypothetical protein
MVPVTAVVNICTELSANVTVTVTIIVEPINAEHAAAEALLEPESVPPGFLDPLHVVGPDKPQPAGTPVSVTVGLVVEWTAMSPVFFNTIEKVAAPAGVATSFT